MNNYKFGFCEWYLPFCGPDTVRFVAKMGYDGIQIGDMGGPANNFPLTNPSLADAYVRAADETGTQLQCLDCISVINNGCLREDPDSKEGRLAYLTMKKGFEACRLMGIKTAFIPSVLKTRIENRYHLKNTIENLRRGNDLAHDMGIEFLYESFSPADVTMDICDASGVRLVYDTLNPLKYGFSDDPAAEIRTYGGKYIHTIHFKDCCESFSGDVPLGTGIGKVKESAKAIREIGFCGWIVNEGTYFTCEAAKAGEDPWRLASEDLLTLKKMFSEERRTINYQQKIYSEEIA